MATNRDPRDRREKHRRLSDVPPPASPPPGSGVEDESGPLARRGFLGWVAGVTVVVSLMAVAAWTLAGWNSERDRTQALKELSDQAAGVHDLVSGLPPLDAESFRAPPDGRERARLARALLGARDAGVHVLTLWRGDVAVYSSDAAIDGRRVAPNASLRRALRGNPSAAEGAGDVHSYLPVADDGGRTLGVLEISSSAAALESALREDRNSIYLMFALVTVALLLALVPVGRRLASWASTRPRRGGPRAVRAIRRGIERGEFELHYQPQVQLETGQPVAVEALLRWRRRGELLSPAQFLPDAEASDAIGPLTDHVLDLALEQAGAWQRAGRKIGVSVNLSAANLRDAGLAARLEGLLAEHDVTPRMITLEVTETAVLEEPEQTRAVLDAIADLGVSLSVDDFGTGYSSLLWLKLFPVTEVKIDRSFVSQMQTDGRAYVSGVIRLAHDLGLSVVAEGVEDQAMLESLQELACDIGQGYLFSRPVPPGEVEAWLDHEVDPDWAPERHELHLRPDYSTLGEARKLVHDTASDLGFDDEAIWDMEVATTEALANAIEHAPVAEDGLIHVRVSRENGTMELQISGGGALQEDSGQSDGHRGRGIAIMNSLMDEVTLRRGADDSLIKLAKRLTP